MRQIGALLKAYETAGAKAELYTIPTGGVRGDGKWIIPKAQDVVDATLDLIEPVARGAGLSLVPVACDAMDGGDGWGGNYV